MYIGQMDLDISSGISEYIIYTVSEEYIVKKQALTLTEVLFNMRIKRKAI